jgi:hypothetical protein
MMVADVRQLVDQEHGPVLRVFPESLVPIKSYTSWMVRLLVLAEFNPPNPMKAGAPALVMSRTLLSWAYIAPA